MTNVPEQTDITPEEDRPVDVEGAPEVVLPETEEELTEQDLASDDHPEDT